MKTRYILLISVPLLELYLLIHLGSKVGGISTLLVVIMTALLGTHVLRRQGRSAIQQAQARWQQGQLPTQAIIDSAVMLLAGILLIIPGLITDGIGALLLLPRVRFYLMDYITRRMLASYPHQQHSEQGETLEGEIVPPTNKPTDK